MPSRIIRRESILPAIEFRSLLVICVGWLLSLILSSNAHASCGDWLADSGRMSHDETQSHDETDAGVGEQSPISKCDLGLCESRREIPLPNPIPVIPTVVKAVAHLSAGEIDSGIIPNTPIPRDIPLELSTGFPQEIDRPPEHSSQR